MARRLAGKHEPEEGTRVKRLIVGLGNPGVQYLQNRHNAGFLVIDRFALAHHLSFSRRRFNALLAEGQAQDYNVLLAKPQTFMNQSGSAVAKLVSFHQLPAGGIIIVYDDLDLPLGRIRIRANGSAGGHHGIESIMNSLGHGNFPRLRVGIGRPSSREDVDHVLGDFTSEEWKILDDTFDRAVGALDTWLAKGVEAAMNSFNAV